MKIKHLKLFTFILDLREENKEIEELIEVGEKHQVKTEERSWSSSLKNDNIYFTGSHCGKSFLCKQNLDLDIFHCGGKPYACDECEKIFTINENLIEHMIIHTAEKPHTCDRRGKSFPQKKLYEQSPHSGKAIRM